MRAIQRIWPAVTVSLAARSLATLSLVAAVLASVMPATADPRPAARVTSGPADQRPAASVSLATIAGQRVRPGYGETVRLGQVVAVSGTVTHPPARASLVLQGRTTAAWQVLLTRPAHNGRFTLHWSVRTRDTQLRTALVAGRRPVATSSVAALLVGPAIVLCHPAPAPVQLPAGDGEVTGGVYLLGGPAPGLDQCQSVASTISATSAGGQVTTQALAGGDGYALVLAPGTYQLRDGECRGTATVTAGRRTVADTDCDFP